MTLPGTALSMQIGMDSSISVESLLRAAPMRGEPTTPDPMDGLRADIPRRLWASQNGAHRQRDRQIEENVRMLAGQQNHIFNPMLGRWIDVSQYLTDDEKRYRQRPIFNRLQTWFTTTHARATENPPIVSFLAGPDRADADLAETLDIICKTIWREADVSDAWDRIAAWMIVAGSAYAQSRVDMEAGPTIEWRGQANIPVVTEDITGTKQVVGQQPAENVPFDQQGNALAVYENGNMVELGPPYKTRQPKIVVDVMSPLECRGEWGPTPWHQKRWHCSRHFLSVGQVKARFGADVPADVTIGLNMSDSGELGRLLFGGGYYGPGNGTSVTGDTSQAVQTEGMVDVYCLWIRPLDGNDQGRYLVATGTGQVLYDGPRPVAYQNTSPIRRWDFVRLPGRAHGTTPLDTLIMPQRVYNKRWAQLLEHAQLVANPKPVIDSAAGIRATEWTNEPGRPVMVNKRAGVHAIEWIAPPPISPDVWKLLGEVRGEIVDLGGLRGTEGVAPNPDASGALVKELRFNSDRFLGPTLRRSPDEFARMFEDWRSLLPLVYPFETLIAYAGKDNAARTLMVRPELFTQGKVNVVADTESMLPEGKGERQQNVFQMWQAGAFGLPTSPQALRQFHELMNSPHISRVAKPGGIDATTAEQENAQLIQGTPAAEIPVFEWYDHTVHLDVLERFMKSPEFKSQPPPVQQECVLHRMAHLQALAPAMGAMMQMGAPGTQPPGGDPSAPPSGGPPAPAPAQAAA